MSENKIEKIVKIEKIIKINKPSCEITAWGFVDDLLMMFAMALLYLIAVIPLIMVLSRLNYG